MFAVFHIMDKLQFFLPRDAKLARNVLSSCVSVCIRHARRD